VDGRGGGACGRGYFWRFVTLVGGMVLVGRWFDV
jgi:hypothetical protein